MVAVAHLPLRLPVVAVVAHPRVIRVEPQVIRVEPAPKGLPLVIREGHVRMSFDRRTSRA